MSKIKSVCVYCGSSAKTASKYSEVAAALGKIFAENNIRLVYGGGSSGTMGVVSNAVMDGGGEVYGVITEFLYDAEGGHEKITELTVVSSMHERKMKMFEAADAFVILPGGLGTLDETFELMTWRQIGVHKKPAVFLNLDGYWDPLLKSLIPEMIAEGFVRPEDLSLFSAVEHPEDILEALDQTQADVSTFSSKWE